MKSKWINFSISRQCDKCNRSAESLLWIEIGGQREEEEVLREQGVVNSISTSSLSLLIGLLTDWSVSLIFWGVSPSIEIELARRCCSDRCVWMILAHAIQSASIYFSCMQLPNLACSCWFMKSHHLIKLTLLKWVNKHQLNFAQQMWWLIIYHLHSV